MALLQRDQLKIKVTQGQGTEINIMTKPPAKPPGFQGLQGFRSLWAIYIYIKPHFFTLRDQHSWLENPPFVVVLVFPIGKGGFLLLC